MTRDLNTRLAAVVPAAEVKLHLMQFADDGIVPNNPGLPTVLMRAVLAAAAPPDAIAARLERSGWGGTWVWQVFPYHHYHPNAHEALVVAWGHAVLMLGGRHGERIEVSAGDAVVLPAGTGHRQLEASPDFTVVGAYPPGREDLDTIRAGRPHDDAVTERIASVVRPQTDPLFGPAGPLMTAWPG